LCGAILEVVILILHAVNLLQQVLHNPHLGLSKTLRRLYELAKVMADCVVPQGMFAFARGISFLFAVSHFSYIL
jgi:hypothetical protein